MPEKETPEKMTPPNPPPFKLILGSSSMSRRQLLAEMGYQFTLMSADIDEKGIRMEKPEELVMALAEAKADAIISKLQITDYKNDIEPTLLITADQVVVYEGVIREKPSSKDEARLFVKGYSGSHTSTVGSVLVTNLKTGVRRGAWDKAEIEEGDVLHVAGGLLLENPLISRFVEEVLILGSASMSRRQILAEMGYQFTLMIADIDEKGIRREKPEELVMALAEAKVVVHEGVILEKPSNKDEARLFIKGYSGSHASTVGSVLVTNLKTGIRRGAWDKAEVYFHDIPDEVIEELIEEGFVLNVAGGLLLEHPLTSRFVEAVVSFFLHVGAADSVMGLPKELTEKLIQFQEAL
ncbi:Maf-like protein [Cinnamomum micranthum f. kanehirae]|uniref:Maf-like protein n=1 Tax=Cinnamomum micranthum f. kanehirae TaxID=337451 RepID=A0A3S3NAU7_9MAGN|nr:Maf-like protein [Cinnamomum micranthum f. kanehirae]